MKLRFKGNSLRLRLSRGEVDRLGAGESVEETVALGSGWSYRVETGGGAIDAGLDSTGVWVRIPEAWARAWAEGDDVGLYATATSDAGGLEVAIEKDFACLVPREGEDDADAFPNPAAES